MYRGGRYIDTSRDDGGGVRLTCAGLPVENAARSLIPKEYLRKRVCSGSLRPEKRKHVRLWVHMDATGAPKVRSLAVYARACGDQPTVWSGAPGPGELLKSKYESTASFGSNSRWSGSLTDARRRSLMRCSPLAHPNARPRLKRGISSTAGRNPPERHGERPRAPSLAHSLANGSEPIRGCRER
jgi:hypothetical protein